MTRLANDKYAIHHIILTYRPEEEIKPLAYKEYFKKQDKVGMESTGHFGGQACGITLFVWTNNAIPQA